MPRLAERYDATNEWPADEVGVQSAKRCRWRCPVGADHVYEANVDTANRSPVAACPFCAGKKPSVTNRLDVLHPEIAAEWDAELNEGPPAVVATSSKSAWWRCAVCGHSWRTRIGRRAGEGTGCPKCAGASNAARLAGTANGRKPKVTIADLPHMAARYLPDNELAADAVAARSIKICRWRCPAGPDHLYETRPATVRDSADGGCPFCAGRELSVTNRLDVIHPEIAAEWDVERNDGSPAVIANSAQPAWWICSACEHRWETTVNNRTTQKSGCPRCARRRTAELNQLPRPGRSLTDISPEVAATWHPTKNAPLGPDSVPAMSNTPRWWLCEQGHEWEVAPSGRAGSKATGCPVCAGFVVTPETSLAAQRPDIAAEWHPTLNGALTPEMVLPAAEMKVWWRCPTGHDYESRLGNRTRNGNGCAYCSGHRIGYGNDLATHDPAVAAEWDYEKNHPVKPTEVTISGAAKYWWLCEQRHSWETTVHSRVGLGTGCPQCGAGWRRSQPEIALQFELEHVLPAPVTGDAQVRTTAYCWHVDVLCAPLRLVVEYDGSFWHRDGLGRDTKKTQQLSEDGWVVIRVRQSPLPMVGQWDVPCAAKEPDPFTMTIQVLESILAAAADAPAEHPARLELVALREASELYQAAGCAQASVEAERAVREGRINRPRPAPSGLPRILKPGQSLAVKSPQIAAEWHPTLNGVLSARDVANSRNAKAWWQCSLCGKDWEAGINYRTQRQIPGCPDCVRTQRRVPAPGESLADQYPEIAAEWHSSRNAPRGPADVKPSSKEHVWWRCSLCGEDWKTAVSTRTRHKNVGCPTCNRARRGAQQAIPRPGQSLADLFPALAAEWHPTKNAPRRPADVKPGSNQSAWWRCGDGHEWQTTVDRRTKKSNPTGCPECALARRAVPVPGQSLADLYPHLAAEWHPTKNHPRQATGVKAGSSERMWWRCSLCGTDWSAVVSMRTHLNHAGCPDCGHARGAVTRSTPKPGQSLAYMFPEVAAQWHSTMNHPRVPEGVMPGSSERAWWRCELGHEWQTTPAQRTCSKPTGCPDCSRARAAAKRSVPKPGWSLADLFPEVAAQWHPTKNHPRSPEGVKPRSSERVWWRCEFGHEWETLVAHRTSSTPTGCPSCWQERRHQTGSASGSPNL